MEQKIDEHNRLNEEKWNSWANTFDSKRYARFRFMQKRLVLMLGLKGNQHLLDIGCGTGWAVIYAASLVNNRGGFYGIDISPKMIEKAKSNSADCSNVFFFQGNAEQLNFKDNFFDFIICSNSFHHYFRPDKVLSETYRVLKSKGRIYILDGTGDNFVIKIADKRAKKKDPTHVKMYSTQEYRELFFNAKLKYISSKSIWGFYAIKVHIAEKRYNNCNKSLRPN